MTFAPTATQYDDILDGIAVLEANERGDADAINVLAGAIPASELVRRALLSTEMLSEILTKHPSITPDVALDALRSRAVKDRQTAA